MQKVLQAGIITKYNNKFLFVKSKNNCKYVFPKGTIKKNESRIQAAIRETHEEAGATMNFDSIKEFCIYKGVFWFTGNVEIIVENREKREILIMSNEDLYQKGADISNKTYHLIAKYRKLM